MTFDDDMAYLMRFFKEGRTGGDFEAGIERGVRALLVNPDFLFRTETDPAGATPGAAYRVSNLELASRLSFFVWSSTIIDHSFGFLAFFSTVNPRLNSTTSRWSCD